MVSRRGPIHLDRRKTRNRNPEGEKDRNLRPIIVGNRRGYLPLCELVRYPLLKTDE
jgi:hypothetical protein